MRFLIVDDSSTMRRMIINTLIASARGSGRGPQSTVHVHVHSPRSTVLRSSVMTEDCGPKTVDRVHLIHAIAVRPPLSGLRRGS